MRVMVIAPHPDDELLGVGGTLIKRKLAGYKLAWVIVTSISEANGWDKALVKEKIKQVENIRDLVGFDHVYELDFPATSIDSIPIKQIVSSISQCIHDFEPDEIFIPSMSDVHTDHQVTHKAAISCVKWFRNPSIKKVLVYETLSETNFGLGRNSCFNPNVYINIEDSFDKKIYCLRSYDAETGVFPFPRSEIAITALAQLRGSAAGYKYAEAFELLIERLD